MADPSDEEAAPLADLAARVDERREQAEEAVATDVFEEQSFDDQHEDAILEAAEESTTIGFGAGGEVVETGERTAVVPKRNFCERCPHFAEPPRASCTHPGTTITAFVDKDHVRVEDCPVVEDRGIVAEGTGD